MQVAPSILFFPSFLLLIDQLEHISSLSPSYSLVIRAYKHDGLRERVIGNGGKARPQRYGGIEQIAEDKVTASDTNLDVGRNEYHATP